MASLRKLCWADLDEIVKIEKIIFQDSAWSRDAYEQFLSEDFWSSWLVLEENSQLIGCCGFSCLYDQAEILTIGVLPDYRGQGYGKMMMETMLEMSRHQGAEIMSLEVRISNLAAQSLYRQFGFIEVAKRRRYYPDGEDALLMIKRWEEE